MDKPLVVQLLDSKIHIDFLPRQEVTNLTAVTVSKLSLVSQIIDQVIAVKKSVSESSDVSSQDRPKGEPSPQVLTKGIPLVVSTFLTCFIGDEPELAKQRFAI